MALLGCEHARKELWMAETTAGEGILASENDDKREQIIELLKKAYWMEIETVMSYIANTGWSRARTSLRPSKATCSHPTSRPTSCT